MDRDALFGEVRSLTASASARTLHELLWCVLPYEDWHHYPREALSRVGLLDIYTWALACYPHAVDLVGPEAEHHARLWLCALSWRAAHPELSAPWHVVIGLGNNRALTLQIDMEATYTSRSRKTFYRVELSTSDLPAGDLNTHSALAEWPGVPARLLGLFV